MPNPRFFKKSGVHTLDSLKAKVQFDLADTVDTSLTIEDVATLENATSKDVSVFYDKKYVKALENTQAGFCVMHPDKQDKAPFGLVAILSKTPHKTFAEISAVFYPNEFGEDFNGVSKTAHIASTAKIGKNCSIDHGVVIGENVELGDNVIIGANTVIEQNVQIGDGCRISSGTVISHAIIGKNTRICTGVRIGQRGFGFSMETQERTKVPQLGCVIIGNNVDVGANTCIDRGSAKDTIIEDDVMIDNLVQIAHNTVIKKGAIIVSQAGVAGSCTIGSYAVLAGQVGLAPGVVVGDGAFVLAQSGLERDVPPGEMVLGTPALPVKEFKSRYLNISRLIRDRNK